MRDGSFRVWGCRKAIDLLSEMDQLLDEHPFSYRAQYLHFKLLHEIGWVSWAHCLHVGCC